MSDSDNSEENLGYYGKPLEPYDEDAFPKKKPITIEEQIATDEQGRRRFHGAFTGGFSAGFFNTVGSLEGWKPTEFKSSRLEKYDLKVRKPEDYMDDEDVGKFGIAPHLVQAKEDFSTKKKRKKETHSIGPIPGTPVLETLLESGNETIGYLLLRNMGFKQTPNELDELEDDNDADISAETGKKVYGCEIPKTYAIKKSFDNKKYEIPKVYEELLKKPKDNTFGLGYSGLDKSHVNLFQPQKRQTQNLVIPGKTKRTNLNIQGQAFGVGAFEEEDDDIYVKDDMAGYDFELTSESSKASSSSKQVDKLVHDMFLLSTDSLAAVESFPPPTIPHSFTGKYKKKKSRFEPVEENVDENNKERGGLINAQMRAKYLGEGDVEGKSYTVTNFQQRKSREELEREKKKEADKIKKNEEFEEKQKKALDSAAQGFLFDRFVSASKPEDPLAILEPVTGSEIEHGTLQMREAARMKMFGPLTRETLDWQPCAILCKRFNLPEPLTSEIGSKHERKRTKNLIFQFQKFDDSGPDLKAGLSTNIQENLTESHQNKEDANISSENLQKSTENIISMKESNIANIIVSSNVNSSSNNPTPSSSSYIEDVNEPPSAPFDIMNKINISQNQDLFKAIFADSSDDETDGDAIDSSKDISVVNENETLQRNELLKATVLSDEFIPKIKPMKIGILSDIKFPVIEDVSKEINTDKKELDMTEEDVKGNKEDSGNFYGPKLPEKIIFKKPQNIIKDRKIIGENSEEWIEKDAALEDNDKRDKSIRKKKHTKHKKHKKSKHKLKKKKM